MAQAPGTDRIQRRFDLLRSQTEQQAGAQRQQMDDDINRAAAAKGRLGSGSVQKVKMQAGQQQDLAKRQALESVESQRDMALGAAEEVQANRDFAKSEREAGQAFAEKTMNTQRDWQKADVAQGRGWQEADMKLQRTWQKQDLKGQKAMWDKQFKEDRRIADFNMKMAERIQNANEQPGKGLLGMGGFLGTGLGGKSGLLGTGLGASPGGGGKIICTEYCRQGWISEEVLKGDLEYAAKHLTLEVRVNYLMWAQYVVPAMQRYPILLYLFWPITYNWVHYMAWKVGRYPHKPLFGPFIEYTATRVSNLIGRSMRAYRREKRSWQYR